MNFPEWYNRKWGDVPVGFADRTFGEEVWKAAQRETWAVVFQIVSDYPHLASREFIKRLEAARGEDGAGPLSLRM